MRLLVVCGFSLAVALWIAFAQLRLFYSLLNDRVILHPVLLQNGFVPYQDIADQKTPLLPLFLSWWLPIFNNDAVLSARTMHALFICLIVLMSMFWVHRHSGRWALLATGIFLLTWSNAFGFWAIMYYDFVLAPLYFVVFMLSVQQIERPATWKMGAMGLITGLAVLTKQYAILLLVPAVGLLLWQLVKGQTTARKFIALGLAYGIGLALPVAIYAWYYYRQAGSFQDLIQWTLIFNIAGPYRSEGVSVPPPSQVNAMLPAFLMLIPFVGSIVFPPVDMKPARGTRLLLLAMFFLGALLIYPRYSTRHWATALPFLAVLSGIACADLLRSWQKQKASVLLLMYASIVLYWTTSALLAYVPALKDPQPQSFGEFTGVIELADQVRDRIPADGGLVLLPTDEGNSNLYYILGRLPPHFWIMNYPWWMNPYSNGRWLEVMEKEKPQTLLFFPGRADLATYAPEILDYVNEKYEVVDTVEWRDSPVQIMLRSPTDLP
jgi:hypothetical protein